MAETQSIAAGMQHNARRNDLLRRVQSESAASRLAGVLAALSTNRLARYGIALVLTAATVIGRWLLNPWLGDHVPFALIYSAVVASAVYCGLGPSIAASVLGIAGARVFLAAHAFHISSMKELSETVTYTGGCVLVVAATEVLRRSKRRLQVANDDLARQAQALRTFNQQLDQRVQQRTTELKRAEESARQLGAQILRMQDEERRRIARDLHDSVGQSVAILNMNLARLARSPNLNERESDTAADSKAMANEVADQLRTISYLLHPPLLDEMGLPAALKWYVKGFSKRSGIATELKISQNFERLAPDCEIAIFRIVQEALTNVHRHSGSRRATVRVNWEPSNVRIEIEDQGKGIPAKKLRDFDKGAVMGVGLSGMRERVAQLGGRLDLQSNERGTLVFAVLPVHGGTGIKADEYASTID